MEESKKRTLHDAWRTILFVEYTPSPISVSSYHLVLCLPVLEPVFSWYLVVFLHCRFTTFAYLRRARSETSQVN